MSRVWKLLCWFLLVISPAVARGAGAASTQKDSPPSDSIVEMDKMVVSAAGWHWRYAKSEHFEILSSVGDDFVAKTVWTYAQDTGRDRLCPDGDFVGSVVQHAEQCIKTFEKNLPTIYRSNRELPAKLIFIENNGTERFFTAIGKIGNGVNPDRTGPVPVQSAINDEQMILICAITRQYMNDSRSALAAKIQDYGDIIARSYLNRCLDGTKMAPPAGYYLSLINNSFGIYWYQVILECYYPDSDNQLIQNLAKDDYENKLSKPGYGKRWAGALLDMPPFSFRDMVENTRLPLRPPPRGCSVEDAQKYISLRRQLARFSNYCGFGPNSKTRDAFVNLIKYRGTRLPVTEEIFKRYFGENYEEFSNEMNDFYIKLPVGGSRYKGMPFIKTWGNTSMVIDSFSPEEAPIAWTDATRSQSARIISDWFFLNKRPDIGRKTLDLADVPSVRSDPEFCATLGLSEIQYGAKTTALLLLEKAASAKIGRPEVYRSLSRLYLENILATKGKDYKLDLAEVQKVFDPLLAALKLWQRNQQTYLQIFELARHANTDVRFPKELWETIVGNCTQLFPDNFDLLNQLVPLLTQNGLKDEATRLLDATEKCPLTTAEQQQLERLKTTVSGRTSD